MQPEGAARSGQDRKGGDPFQTPTRTAITPTEATDFPYDDQLSSYLRAYGYAPPSDYETQGLTSLSMDPTSKLSGRMIQLNLGRLVGLTTAVVQPG
jgi:hypothetical protein